MTWPGQDRKLTKWEFLCFLSGFMHCAVLTAQYKSCYPSLVGDTEKNSLFKGSPSDPKWVLEVYECFSHLLLRRRQRAKRKPWLKHWVFVKRSRGGRFFHPSKLHFKADWQQCRAWKQTWWCLSSISMLGRQKCPTTSVTPASRGGKPALDSKAGECLVKEFLHEIWEQINLEAKFTGLLEKTCSAKADIMTCKNACNSAHENEAVPLTCLRTSEKSLPIFSFPIS